MIYHFSFNEQQVGFRKVFKIGVTTVLRKSKKFKRKIEKIISLVSVWLVSDWK